jgi:raffinose/stachyose/melibiose transport system permease protein
VNVIKSAKYIFLYIYVIISLYPFVWVFISSLKSTQEILMKPFSLPHVLQFKNYYTVWLDGSIGNSFINSIIISGITLITTLLVASMASYILARVYPNLTLYTYFAVGIMIPVQTILIPSFILLKFIHLVNTRTGLIIEYIASSIPLSIFLIVAFMKSLPREIEEAAVMDGCSRSRTFSSIIVPLTMPAIATVGILLFMNVWNEYLFAYVLLSSKQLHTITVGIYAMKTEFGVNYGPLTAGLSIAMIPVIIVYILFQEKVIQGMTAGAVKG